MMNNSLCLKQFRLSHGAVERGAVIPLVAMFAFIILIFSAWVIDLSLAGSAREQAEHYARLTCLAAIEAHFQGTGSNSNRVNAALERAKNVSKTAVRLSDPDFTATDQQAKLRRADDQVSEGAMLVPGQFFYDLERKDPNGAMLTTPINRCPQGLNPPCFREVDPNGTDSVSAYRVVGSLYTGITTKIGAVFGIPKLQSQVLATCAVVPRRLAFTVDLSPSMVRESHIRSTYVQQKQDPNQFGRGGEVAYCLQSENPEITVNPRTDGIWNWLNGTGNSTRATASSAPENPPQPTTSSVNFQTFHYRDDFAHIRTLNDESYDSNPDYFSTHHHPSPTESGGAFSILKSRWYYVDKFQNSDYLGPQPLTTVFEGINAAVTAFRERAVAGDQIAILFYDTDLIWPRVIKPNNDWDYMDRLTKFRGDPSAVTDDPVTATSTSIVPDVVNGNTDGMLLAFRHSLFPARPRDGSIAYTNTLLAISQALTMLANSSSSANPSQDGIVLIGDVQPNCDNGVCGNDYAHYSAARARMLQTVSTQMVGKQTPLHVLMVGQNVGPHTISVARDPGSLADNQTTNDCLTDAEARSSNRPFVAGRGNGDTLSDLGNGSYDATQRFNNQSKTTPFFEANVAAYEMAKLTQGIWAPLRPPKALSGGVCPPVSCTNEAKRELFDPLCRSYGEQIADYMGQIIGQNPYLIVEAE